MAKPEIRLKNLMAACSSVDDVRGRAVLRQHRPLDSFCGRPLLRSGRFSKPSAVYVESLQPSNKQVFLLFPIKIDRGARYSRLLGNIIDGRSAVTELAKSLYRRHENLLSCVI